MRLLGTLRSWNDDRGFGFITPGRGGPDVFVHVSALPRGGPRPVVGEVVTYELGRGKDGRPKAVKVGRRGLEPNRERPRLRRTRIFPNPPVLRLVVGLILLVILAKAGFDKVRRWAAKGSTTALSAVEETETFQCDGRIHCSQMNSCAEARYFLEHCPGVKMDGDHDGVPCEQRCGSGF